jgi:LPXTG-motif cell wall-anchored protein
MKIFNKMQFKSLLLTPILLVMITAPKVAMAAQPTLKLGTTAGFAVLAGSTITNTGATTINGSVGGNVGLYPGTIFSGKESVNLSEGAIHLTDTIASKAKDDLVTAYDDAVGRLPVTRIPSELGETTLTPGVYDSADGTFQITGKLTLDAKGDSDGVFIFKAASTLITASSSDVNLINSARFCRTFWSVGSSATLGTNSNFVGHILAMQSITATTGAKIQGQLLARNGAVTLDNNTITNGICDARPVPVPAPAPATLNVIKHVVNDEGGKAIANNFNIHVKTNGKDVAESPAPGAESPGNSYTLAAGTYTISEDSFNGYTASYGGNSDAKGNITLAPGDNKTIIVTNNDIAASSIINDNSEVSTPAVPKEKAVTTTVAGGVLPKTSSNLYELLLLGAVLTLGGVLNLRKRKRNE